MSIGQTGASMSAIVSGLIGAAVAVALATLAERKLKPAQANAEGWQTLRPGWLVNATFVATTAFAALMAFYLLSGGSSLPDADTQNFYALLLAVVSGIAAIYLAWTTYGRTVMWKGTELRVRTCVGRDTTRPLADVSSVAKNEALGDYRLTFCDGGTLRVSAYMHGVNDLLSRIPKRAHKGF